MCEITVQSIRAAKKLLDTHIQPVRMTNITDTEHVIINIDNLICKDAIMHQSSASEDGAQPFSSLMAYMDKR